jgi:hypothetical protein
MTTFLRLEIFTGRADVPAAFVLVNTDHIVRIHPTWPSGCNIISSQVDEVSLHVTASLDELQQRLCSTGGRTQVYSVPAATINEAYEAARADLLP